MFLSSMVVCHRFIRVHNKYACTDRMWPRIALVLCRFLPVLHIDLFFQDWTGWDIEKYFRRCYLLNLYYCRKDFTKLEKLNPTEFSHLWF